MVTLYDIEPGKLIEELSKELKNLEEIKAPEWASFVKTGAGKERPPVEKDWWHKRAASVMRKTFANGPIGVSKLRKKYSSKKNRGHKPEKVYVGSGNILRKILQQLEKAELVKYVEKGVHKGRIVTPKGEKLLNKIAKNLLGKASPKEEKKETPKKEPLLKKDVHEKKKEEKKKEVKEKPKEEIKKEVKDGKK